MGSLQGLISYAIPLLIVILGVFLPKDKVETRSNTQPATNTEIVKITSTQEPGFTPIIATIKAKRNTEISSGIITTYKGDDLLVLVNKHIRLPSSYEPRDLVGLDGVVAVTKPGLKLRKEAADALVKMAGTAKAEGVNLAALSTYRSYWQQQNTFDYWVAKAGLHL